MVKSLHFIDFEVYEKDWLCVIVDPINKTETIIVNNKKELEDYYNKFKDEIFVGYNIRNYDQYIFKSILLDFNPKTVNDAIIVQGKKGFEISDLFNKIQLITYDVMTSISSLKTLEAYMGHNIHETGVDFNIKRKLTKDEIEETIGYCKNDVYELINVFSKRFSEFEAVVALIEAFDHPIQYISKTKSQISALTLECSRQNRNDEWDLYTVDTIQLSKYYAIKDWFLNDSNHDYKKFLEVYVACVKHKFAWGGLHGAIEKYHSKGNLWHVDVASFYPSLMISYDLLSRNVKNKEKYIKIKEDRLVYKAANNALQKPYKFVLNGAYGICKDKYSSAYDPRNANLVCVNGQLLLLDLIEKLEIGLPGFKLIQSNTDGLIIEIPESSDELMKEICQEWIDRVHCQLEFDQIDEIWQKDVNNYIFHFKDTELNGKNRNKFERKGGYAKENSELDNDLPILNDALFNYFSKGISVKDTIMNCNEFIKFQKIYKVSKSYSYAWHNNKILSDKTYRVFASKNSEDTFIGKMRDENSNIDRFQETPEHCFINNGDIRNKEIPSSLDYNWYIDKANDRISSFCIL